MMMMMIIIIIIIIIYVDILKIILAEAFSSDSLINKKKSNIVAMGTNQFLKKSVMDETRRALCQLLNVISARMRLKYH